MNAAEARFFGKYEVRHLLGQGGMATVYEGIHPDLDRRVAIKVMRPQLAAEPGFEERFRREARLVASLRHPHIVQLYDFDIADGQPFMVMEYLEGGTFADRLASVAASGMRMTLDEAAAILEAMASALDYAHSRGAVHRDIKPSNIFFTKSGEPVLGDFGIAHLLEDSLRLTMTGGVVGSPIYMSPEQAAGLRVDGRSDLYTLGVVLYEMVTGRVPFEGPTPTAVLLKHVQEPPPPPTRLNPHLNPVTEQVILRALAKDPSARYATCGEFARAFRESLISQDADATSIFVSPDAVTLVDAAPASDRELQAGVDTERQPFLTGDSLTRLAGDEASAPATADSGWFTRAMNVVNVLAPLVGKEPQSIPRAESRRARVMAGLSAAAILVALLRYLSELTGFIKLPPGAWSRLLPWLLVALMAGVAVASVNALRQAGTRKGRIQAGGVFIAVLMFALIWGGWTAYQKLRPPERFRIVIADFDDRHATSKRDMARRFEQSLRSQFDSLGIDVELILAKQFFESSEAARKYGDERKALMVIWGWYDDDGVGPRIELLQVRDVSASGIKVLFDAAGIALARSDQAKASLSTEIVRYSHVPATVPSLEFVSELGDQELTYVATTAVGLGLYANQQYDDALAAFDRALTLGGEFGDSILGREYTHFYRAVILDMLGRDDESVHDLEQAVALNPDLFEAHYNLAIAYTRSCGSQSPLSDAVAEAEEAVRLRPERLDALRLLGQLYIEAGRPEQAVTILQKAITLFPDDVGAHLLLGSAYDNAGQRNEALRSYARAQSLLAESKEDIDEYERHVQAGDLHVLSGDYDSALTEYQAAQAIDAERIAAYRGMGNAYFWQDETERALSAYQTWADLAPDDADAWLMLGLTHIARDEGEAAIAALRKSSQLSDCDPAPHLLLGGQLALAGDYAGAIPSLEKAVALNPTDVDARYILASAYYQTGDFDNAMAAIQAVLEAKPDDVRALRVLSQAAVGGGDVERALAALERLSELEPDDGNVRSMLADAYFQANRYAEALATYESALKLREDVGDLGSAALAAAMLDDIPTARSYADRALEIDAQSRGALLALGFINRKEGDYNGAIQAYEQALQTSEDALTYRFLAESYALAGRYEEAIVTYEKTVALQPDDYSSYVQLGNLYARLNDLNQAENAYRKGLEINEKGHEALAALADVAYRQCNLSSAVQSLQTAVSLAPDNVIYLSSLASLYEAQGREEDAAFIYQKLASASDNDVLAQLAVANHHFRLGELNQAAQGLERLLESSVLSTYLEGLARNLLADVYMAQGRTLLARGEYELALQKLPFLVTAQASLGDILLSDGDAEAALRAYDLAEQLLPNYQLFFPLDQVTLQEVFLYLRRAIAYQMLGDDGAAAAMRDKASERAQNLLDTLPRAPLSHFTWALVQSERGDEEAAEKAFSRASQCDKAMDGVRAQVEARLSSLRK